MIENNPINTQKGQQKCCLFCVYGKIGKRAFYQKYIVRTDEWKKEEYESNEKVYFLRKPRNCIKNKNDIMKKTEKSRKIGRKWK